jgi:cytochrome c-type biogenesis protein CcmH/NrfG
VLALAIITIAAYAPVRHFKFVGLDDPASVSENPFVMNGLTWVDVAWAFGLRVHFWMPATWISYMAEVSLHGVRPGWFHVTNVALHLAGTLALFAWLVRATGARGRSAFVAAMFAVHPLHVESVAWITERKDVLSTLFWWLATGAYVAYVRRPAWTRYALVLTLFLLGLMAKPMLVTLPATLLLLDLWPLRRIAPGATLAAWWPLIREKLPLAAIAGVLSVVAVVAQGSALSSTTAMPMALRVPNVLVSYATYLGKMFWPAGLAAFYPFDPSPPAWLVAAGAIVLVAGSIAALASRRRRPYVTVGWFWYVGTLVPVIGIVQVGAFARADRFTYVPLVGLFIVIAWGAEELAARWRLQRAVLPAAAVALTLACTVASRQQVWWWQDTVTLWQRVAHVLLGQDDQRAQDMIVAMLRSQGRLSEIAEHAGNATPAPQAVPPSSPDMAAVHSNKGAALASRGQVAEALVEFQEAVRLRPDFAEAQDNLGLALAQLGRVDEAIPYFAEAVRLRPDLAVAHIHLGMACVTTGRMDQARRELTEAVRLDPKNEEARAALARYFK